MELSREEQDFHGVDHPLPPLFIAFGTAVAPTSLVECPICEAEFLLASVAPRAIPKARVVEASAAEAAAEGEIESEELAPTPARRSPSTFSIVVDEEGESSAPAPDSLSRLLRSTADWQLPGIQLPRDEQQVEAAATEEDEEIGESLDLELSDDRIIPNDHAPRTVTFGDTPANRLQIQRSSSSVAVGSTNFSPT